MILNKQNNIEFSSPVEVLFDREELKHAIYWYSKKPVCRLKHVYLHGKYYAVSIYDKKIHIHRAKNSIKEHIEGGTPKAPEMTHFEGTENDSSV